MGVDKPYTRPKNPTKKRKASDDCEETLLIINECFVYKIPPRPSAEGYRAKDWNIETFIWSGRLVIKAQGDICIIRLENPDTGEVFAMCPVNTAGPQTVEPVLDSSRYFVLRIEDGRGHHAFIGMGFTERSEAFDFNVALQDHAKEVKRKKELKNAQERLSQEPTQDFSLKEGQTITVNLKAPKKATPSASQSKAPSGGDTPFLPPPPGSKKRPTAPAARAAKGSTDWGF